MFVNRGHIYVFITSTWESILQQNIQLSVMPNEDIYAPHGSKLCQIYAKYMQNMDHIHVMPCQLDVYIIKDIVARLQMFLCKFCI